MSRRRRRSRRASAPSGSPPPSGDIDGPEQRMVVVPAGVVADRGLLVGRQRAEVLEHILDGCDQPTRCPRAPRSPCRRTLGGACRGGSASSAHRCAARARRSRRAGAERSRTFLISRVGIASVVPRSIRRSGSSRAGTFRCPAMTRLSQLHAADRARAAGRRRGALPQADGARRADPPGRLGPVVVAARRLADRTSASSRSSARRWTRSAVRRC